MVQLVGLYSRVRKVQVVLMALLKLDSPVRRRRAGEPRMQEVICGISQGLYCRICAGPRESADVPTLEGIGLGHPLLPRPTALAAYGRVHTSTPTMA